MCGALARPTERPRVGYDGVMNEAQLEARFRQAVRSAGGLIEKLAPTSAGVPDRLVLMPGGRMFLVELKADGGSLRPIQRHWHERAAALGTEVIVLRGLPAVLSWVQAEAQP